jgi:hypothetical protein
LLTDTDFSDGSTGEIFLDLTDSNDNQIFIETDSSFIDSQPHLLVVNVDSNQGASGVEIYVDDMTQTGGVPTTTVRDTGFDANSYANSPDMAFFAGENRSSTARHKAVDLAFIEFNEQPYSQQDRLDLLRRAPGL